MLTDFDEMLTDLFVVRANGDRSGVLRGTVDRKRADIFDENLVADPGDELRRPLPNGREEVFRIVDVTFHQGIPGEVAGHFELELAKGHEAPKRPATTIHINNSTGIQVGDNNTINIQNAFTELLGRIDGSSATPAEKSEAKSRVAAVLEHPIVAAVLGGAAGGLIGLTK